MAKPRLVKVRALFYVLQHICKRGASILIHPLFALSTTGNSRIYLNHTATAASLRLCDCRLSSRSLSARFRPALLIVAVVGTFVLRELADFHC